MLDSEAIGRVIARGAQNAASVERSRNAGTGDVWKRNGQPPATAAEAQIASVKDAVAKVGEAEGALATAGAAIGALTAIEQAISAQLSAIPFPAFPAVRITDKALGLPHAHMHPPNLIPPAPPVPLPSMGPVIKIPFISGADTVFINGLPAARCGDLGLGIWCGGYFPLYEIFLGSSSVWIEGARAARLGVDITKHCVFTTPRPSDPPLGPMVGTTITGSPNVVIGGIPMPSLTAMAIGAAFKVAFKGVGKAIRAARNAAKTTAKASKIADDVVPMFSKGKAVAPKSRPQALAEVMEEIRAKNVEVVSNEEAVSWLDYAAKARGADPSTYHACTWGEDLIYIRPEHVDNPRILREELIHTDQAKAGKISSDKIVANEIEARELMMKNADEWGITPDEVAEMQREVEIMKRTGVY